jgi:hypothetical protein
VRPRSIWSIFVVTIHTQNCPAKSSQIECKLSDARTFTFIHASHCFHHCAAAVCIGAFIISRRLLSPSAIFHTWDSSIVLQKRGRAKGQPPPKESPETRYIFAFVRCCDTKTGFLVQSTTRNWSSIMAFPDPSAAKTPLSDFPSRFSSQQMKPNATL